MPERMNWLNWTDYIPLIQSSQQWVKIYFVILFLATAGFIAVLILAPHESRGRWPLTGDPWIDQIYKRLNTLPEEPDEGRTADVISTFFNNPHFLTIVETEDARDAMFQFCVGQKIVSHYRDSFAKPEIRADLMSAESDLIYLQEQIKTSFYPFIRFGDVCEKNSNRDKFRAAIGQSRETRDLDANAREKIDETLRRLRQSLQPLGVLSQNVRRPLSTLDTYPSSATVPAKPAYTTSPAVQSPPISTSATASIVSYTAMTLTFLNRTGQPIELYWLDTDGNARLEHSLADGEQGASRTYKGHVWSIRTKGGHELHRYVADPSVPFILIGRS